MREKIKHFIFDLLIMTGGVLSVAISSQLAGIDVNFYVVGVFLLLANALITYKTFWDV